jgi:hypothetical protein
MTRAVICQHFALDYGWSKAGCSACGWRSIVDLAAAVLATNTPNDAYFGLANALTVLSQLNERW